MTWDSRAPVEPGYSTGSGQPGADSAQAAESNEAVKARIATAVLDARDEVLDLSHRIHANPEPAFEEHQAAAWVAEALAEHGYAVEFPVGRLPTALRARLAGGAGAGGTRVGILAEYDALPGLGHGCGHNSMAASGVGAAIALAAVAPHISGEIVFLGTPAEERGSGKQFMIDDGLFEGLDAALLYHPSDINSAVCALLASVDVEVTFRGLQAHAAADPWMGKNALDALILLFQSVGLWRQQLRPTARVHDANRFFRDRGPLSVPRRYGARWVLVDRKRVGDVRLHEPEQPPRLLHVIRQKEVEQRVVVEGTGE